MTKSGMIVAAALATVAVAACRKAEPARPAPSAAPTSSRSSSSAAPAAPSAPAFSHNPTLEVFGYYLPAQQVVAGAYRLRNISLGSEEDFRNWEANKRLSSYAPVMLEFEDSAGGGDGLRVLPDRYAVGDQGVTFEGRDPKLGAVSFHGRFDAHGFAAARRGDAPQAVVLIGEVKAAGKTFPETRFTWFGGD